MIKLLENVAFRDSTHLRLDYRVPQYEKLSLILSAYDAPGSQGGQNTARIELPGIRQIVEPSDSTLEPSASRTGLPNNCEGSVPPIGEEEAIEIGNAALLDYTETHGIGKAESDAVEVIAKAIHHALAKRLGWM